MRRPDLDRERNGKQKLEASRLWSTGRDGIFEDCLDLLGIPERTRLCQLCGEGFGTAMIEGLTSNLVRLASKHGVLVSKLIQSELAQLASIPLVTESYGRKYFCFSYAYSLNGWGDTTNALIAALELGTKLSGFRDMTMFSFQHAISARNLFSEVRRWCPICFSEWQKASQTIYEPLLWSIKVVTACTVHEVQLQDRCRECHSQTTPFCAHTTPGRCSECFAWLGVESQGARERLEKPHGDAVRCARSVGEMLVFCSRLDPPEVASRLQAGLTALVNANCGMCVFRQKCGLAPSEHSAFPISRPELPQLVRISQCLDIPLTSLFGKGVPHPDARETKRRDEVAEALRLALHESPPPTLAGFAIRIGEDPNWVIVNCPELVAQLKSQRSRQVKTPLTEQRGQLLVELIPEAHNLTLKELEKRTQLSAAYMSWKFPAEYRELAKRLRRPRRETAAGQRENLEDFALELVREYDKHGYFPTFRDIRSAVPNGLPTGTDRLTRALIAARERYRKEV